jgi:hypothetical protein
LPTEVDWKAGIITRKRSKTRKARNAPTVAYRLWPTTLTLLKKHRSSDSTRVLTSVDGAPLVVDEVSVNNKGSKRDNIAAALDGWMEGKSPGFAAIRKASATKLGEHADFRAYAQYFLAQAPRGVADKFYVLPSAKQFDRALAWLGKQYGC